MFIRIHAYIHIKENKFKKEKYKFYQSVQFKPAFCQHMTALAASEYPYNTVGEKQYTKGVLCPNSQYSQNSR